jgi:CDP-diacylglycerol--glycerol-3-phosphate 3-phosphatidyltransferase
VSWTNVIGRVSQFLINGIVRALVLTRIPPNAYTYIGLAFSIGAALLFGYAAGDNQPSLFRYAALVILLAGFLDMLDGQVARASNRATVFGAFLDSVLDRYSDAALFFGLLVYYARANRFFYVVLVAVVMISSVMVSYTRARAEALIGNCKVGFMERPERLVLIILGGLFNRMAPVLWVIAVIASITVVHRILYTRQMTKPMEAGSAGA